MWELFAEFLKQFGQAGFLAVVCILEGFIIFYLFKELRSETGKRVADANLYPTQYSNAIKDLIHAIANLDKTTQNQGKAIENQERLLNDLISYQRWKK